MNTRTGSHRRHLQRIQRYFKFSARIDLPPVHRPIRRFSMEPGILENEELGCIDLTANDTLDGDVIDLTDSIASQNHNVVDSDPVVVISPVDVDNADTHRRETTRPRRHRIYFTPSTGLSSDDDTDIDGVAAVQQGPARPSGSGRSRSRRNNAARPRRNNSARSTRNNPTIDVDDLSDDNLPEVPFEVPARSSGSGDPTTPVKVTCPICLDTDAQVRRRNRELFSTTCGHIFCDACIKQAIETQRSCPTCRKRLSKRQIHKIYL